MPSSVLKYNRKMELYWSWYIRLYSTVACGKAGDFDVIMLVIEIAIMHAAHQDEY
jgi:hypothetical protein